MTINFLNIFQVLIGIALVGFILIQRGPGATAGSAFGAGASGTVFGAKGSGSFLTKTTALLATAFFIVTLMIAIDSRTQYTAGEQQAAQDLGVVGNPNGEANQQPTVPQEVPEQTADSQAAAITETSAEPATAVAQELTEPVEQVADEAQVKLSDAQEKVKQTAIDQAEQITDKVKTEVEQKVDQAKQKIDQAVSQSNDG